MTRTWVKNIRDLLHHEAAGGALLLMATILALLLVNSPLNWIYNALLTTPVAIQVSALVIDKPLLLWINDGLMVIFFFLVGLEIKRELIEGHLSSWRESALPVIAAVGGMLIPALIYVFINYDNPEAIRGWAIPSATDIAFAVGILALLGRRVPTALKVFLLALAIIDDLGAIIIIALFYTAELSLFSLSIAVVGSAILFTLNALGVTRTGLYIVVGVVIWVCVLKSGVHATLAGVVIAFSIPLRTKDGTGTPPLRRLERELHPWVAFGVMPLFAFANAGVPLYGLSIADLLMPIPLGIALGLFFGKQIGVLGFAWIGTKLGLCRIPDGVGWLQVYGVALLAGIGFTMSLFIGTLAFADQANANAVRLGVLAGSTLSAISGYLLLRLTTSSYAKAVPKKETTYDGALRKSA
ncbi:MAG: Na+/H+ antiporter NhaA [Rhodospirillales bacterium]